MKDKQEDKLSMALATQKVMNDNSSLWSGIPAMVTAVSGFGNNIAAIQSVRLIQEQDKRGIPIDKEEKKQDAIEAALVVIGGLKAFARANKDNTLLKKIDYSHTELDKVRDTVTLDRLKIVRDEANIIIGLLGSYNVTATEVNALSGAIAAYEVMIPKPRVALNISKSATEHLKRLLKEMDEPLKIMDGLMDTLKTSQKTFWKTYKNARIIVDSGSGGSGVKGTIKDKLTGAGLEGARVSVNAPLNRTRTNARSATRTMTDLTNAEGNYAIRRLREGKYILTIQMEGYKDLQITVTIEKGKITDADGEMERVA